MFRSLINFRRDQSGSTALEYAWIVSLISLAAVAVLYSINQKMQGWYWPAVDNLAS